MKMYGLEQTVLCPGCNGFGWTRRAGNFYECPVCETRGRLIVNGEKTLSLPPMQRPQDNGEFERLWLAIVENTKGDLFWLGEVLLSELEKTTGYNWLDNSKGDENG